MADRGGSPARDRSKIPAADRSRSPALDRASFPEGHPKKQVKKQSRNQRKPRWNLPTENPAADRGRSPALDRASFPERHPKKRVKKQSRKRREPSWNLRSKIPAASGVGRRPSTGPAFPNAIQRNKSKSKAENGASRRETFDRKSRRRQG